VHIQEMQIAMPIHCDCMCSLAHLKANLYVHHKRKHLLHVDHDNYTMLK
jgi:hypothetical protein